MQTHLVHFCEACGYHTPVNFSASVFSQNNACSHCGAIYTGVNQANQGQGTSAADRASDNDLAALLSQNLQLSRPAPQQEQAQLHPLQSRNDQPIVYASTHYTQSAHLRRPASTPLPESTSTSIFAPSPSLAATEPASSEIVNTLLAHSIDPSSLLPAQLSLFANAAPEQRLRLLELWRISPPGPHVFSGPMTSMATEEEAAKARYDAQMRERRASAVDSGVGDGDMDMSGDEGMGALAPTGREVEPYVLSGYEMLAAREYAYQAQDHQQAMLRESTRYNQATDPAFKGNSGSAPLWGEKSVVDMENQYGAFQMRGYDNTSPVDVSDDTMMF